MNLRREEENDWTRRDSMWRVRLLRAETLQPDDPELASAASDPIWRIRETAIRRLSVGHPAIIRAQEDVDPCVQIAAKFRLDALERARHPLQNAISKMAVSHTSLKWLEQFKNDWQAAWNACQDGQFMDTVCRYCGLYTDFAREQALRRRVKAIWEEYDRRYERTDRWFDKQKYSEASAAEYQRRGAADRAGASAAIAEASSALAAEIRKEFPTAPALW